MSPNPLDCEPAILTARTGFEVLRGNGWFQPIVAEARWPIGVLRVNRVGVRVAGSLFGWEFARWGVRWADVTLVRPTWIGMRIDFEQSGTHYELLLRSLRLWQRFEEACREHGFELV